MIYPVFGVVELGMMLLASGLSVLAGYLLKTKIKNPLQDEKPTQLATRGSFCAWLIGTHKVGPIFCWVGNRVHTRERSHGGKGGAFGSDPKVDVWYEDGMHVLCVGTVHALHQILSNGEVLFQGPITCESHPSGSLIDLGSYGSFNIYWGEADQPINTSLGDPGYAIGIDSRWPCYCYIQWRSLKLGTSVTWPMLEYVIERCPQETILTDTDPWIDPTWTLCGERNGIEAVNNGIEGVGYFRLGDASGFYYAGRPFYLTGNALPDQQMVVLKQEYVVILDPSEGYVTRTKVFPVGGLSGASGAGFLEPYTSAQDDGANAAHIIADLLFAEWPTGLGLDQDDWDMDSLEDLGTVLESEGMNCHLMSASGDKGESAQALLGAAIQDMGCLIPINTDNGKIMFRPIREELTIQTVPADMLLDLPEISVLHDQRPVDRIIFSFLNRDVGFREMTFVVSDDGQAEFLQHQSYQKVDIKTTSNSEVAAKIAQRRGQEELGNGSLIRLGVGRAARSFIPGDVFYLEGYPEALRVSTVEVDPETSKVQVGFITDFYGVPLSTFTNGMTTIDPGVLPVAPDLATLLVEVPEYLLSGDPQTAIVARIRAHSQIYSTSIHISQDNVTYTPMGSDSFACAGGSLDEEFEPGYFYLEQGPIINVLGPDIANVLDLSGDLTSWALGRQLAFINGEIFFLQSITALGGDQYRLDGLLRARYDTQQETHDVDDYVFIMTFDDAFPLQDILLEPEQDLYAKSQPRAGGVMPLSGVAPAYRELYGKGVRPIPVSSLRVTSPHLVNAYSTGEDITVEWAYSVPSVPGLGAGLQGAGTAVGTPDPEGSFQVDILTSGDVLKRSESVSTATYTYTNANLISDLGSEVDFKIRVTQLRNGYLADSTTITVEAI